MGLSRAEISTSIVGSSMTINANGDNFHPMLFFVTKVVMVMLGGLATFFAAAGADMRQFPCSHCMIHGASSLYGEIKGWRKPVFCPSDSYCFPTFF